MTTPTVATLNYLQKALAHRDTYAVLSQDASGNLTISAEVGPGVSNLALDPLEGPAGASGQQQFPLNIMPEILADPKLLPTDLTNTVADIGRTYLISITDDDGNTTLSGAFIWFPSDRSHPAEFRYLPFGTQGPPGPYGVISPYVSLPGPGEVSQVVPAGTGTAADPYRLTVELSVPEGPAGPSATLASMADVLESTPPTVGQLLAYNGQSITYEGNSYPLWAPTDTGDIAPRPYIVPQSAFSSQVGITFSSTVTIGHFSVPAQAFDWKPIVWGQVEMFEIELALNPLQIGVEVRLGDPHTGTLVARGFGNSLGGVVTVVPHCSSPGSPDTQMTPWNDVGLVSANHGGPEGTLYFNLVNDGIVALYDFQQRGAQMLVMAVAATTQTALQGVIPASLTTKVVLSAKTITKGS